MIGLILCGGLGTRLKDETVDKPKCMVEVGGKPVLERISDYMSKNNISRIVVNLHKFPEVVMKHFGQRFLYMYEPVPMGEFATISLVKSWFPNEPLLVMNGDTLTDLDLNSVDLERYDACRFVSSTTNRHMGTSFYPAGPMPRETNKQLVDCEYFDIGLPDKLTEVRKKYE